MNKKEYKEIKKAIKRRTDNFEVKIGDINHLPDGNLLSSTDGSRIYHFSKSDSKLFISTTTLKGNEILLTRSSTFTDLKTRIENGQVLIKLSSYEFMNYLMDRYDLKPSMKW